MKIKTKTKTLGIVILLALALTACTSEPLTNTATYHDYKLELLGADVDGNTLKVNATFTNSGEEPNYALSAFATRAFQNDTELTSTWEAADNHNLTTEVKDGQSISVTFYFELQDKSDVEVLIGEPTAEQKTVGEKVYVLEE